MRAGPYDLTTYGLAPIPIKRPTARPVRGLWRGLAAKAVPVRVRLIEE